MPDRLDKFAKRYAAALQDYLAHGQEAVLQFAYDLGRQAAAEGLGVLDMVRIHQRAALGGMDSRESPPGSRKALQAAETFFMEAMSPFEATHRGFRETNFKLSELNETLAHRNVELAAINRALKKEIAERRRTEEALRESKEHYRLLFNEARLMQDNLRNLSNRIVHVQEEERKRISRELHDEVGQALTAVNVHLTMLRNAAQLENPELREKIIATQQLLEQTMEVVHRFARELRPAMLDDLGLTPALRSYIKAFAERTGMHIRFNACPTVEQLGSEEKTVLYRVAQESLTNVAKHAQASEVEMNLRHLKNTICMEIKDNGKAFRVEQHCAANGKKRLGLLGMQERVRLVNGNFAVESEVGKGTTVRVEIPVPVSSVISYEKFERLAG